LEQFTVAEFASLNNSPSPRERARLKAMIEASLPRIRADSAQALARTARLRVVQSEETIFQQGEEVPLTLMVRGHGGFRRTTVDGQQLTVGIANPGEIFGITSIAATISSVELVALTDGEVAMWRGSDLRRLAVADSDLALEVIDRLATFLNILTEKLDGFLHQDARRRVIRVLARHQDLFFADPPVLSRAHLPGLVGTSREMTGRVLRDLEREGTVARVGRAGLKLLDPKRLDLDLPRQPRGAN
jgi:CRP-like cAMP-binding protein